MNLIKEIKNDIIDLDKLIIRVEMLISIFENAEGADFFLVTELENFANNYDENDSIYALTSKITDRNSIDVTLTNLITYYNNRRLQLLEKLYLAVRNEF